MPITSEEIEEIRAGIKANTKALNGCVGPHEFTIADEKDLMWTCSDGKLYRRYGCTKCGGKVSSSDKRWYELGLNDGRKHNG